MYRALVFTLVFCVLSKVVFGGEDDLVCAKFRENYKWSKGQEIEAVITSGDALNRSYKTHNYSGHSTYVIIYLDGEDPYIIELNSPYLLGDGSTGEDQHGRRWKIIKTKICF